MINTRVLYSRCVCTVCNFVVTYDAGKKKVKKNYGHTNMHIVSDARYSQSRIVLTPYFHGSKKSGRVSIQVCVQQQKRDNDRESSVQGRFRTLVIQNLFVCFYHTHIHIQCGQFFG